jgi:hypothetical protein
MKPVPASHDVLVVMTLTVVVLAGAVGAIEEARLQAMR